jgi:Flp pilus assembly protein TadD
MKTSSLRDIQNAKELHLIKESSSDDILNKENLPEMTGEEYEKLADDQFRRGNLGTAFVKYQKSIERNPKNNRIHYKIGLLYLVCGTNKDAIRVREFREVLKKEPDHALSHEGIGIAFFRMKKYKDAESCFRQAVEYDSKLWKAHNFLGIIHDYNGQHEAAVREYEVALVLSDNNPIIYNNLGTCHLLAGNYKKAVDALTKVAENETGHSSINNNLGMALAMQGRYDEALEAFGRGGDEAQAYNNLGCIYLRNGEKQKAIRCFEKAIELKPTYYAKARKNLKKAKLSVQLNSDSQFDSPSEHIFEENTLLEENLEEASSSGIIRQITEDVILKKGISDKESTEKVRAEKSESRVSVATGGIKVGRPDIWKDLMNNSVKIRFKLKKTDSEATEIKAYSFIVLNPEEGSQAPPKCFPNTVLKEGRPKQFQKGERFSISRYKFVSASFSDIESMSNYRTATVYVYSEAGNLLTEKVYEINKT